MEECKEPTIQGQMNKILIVDDDAKVREVLYQLLQKSGYQVKTLPSGATALEHLKKERPDLIILDQRMPEMDGLETLKRIRAFDKEIPIVMLTGYGSGDLQIKALKLGINDFLMKGTPTGRFLKAVEDVLERQKMFACRKEPAKKTGAKIMVIDDDPAIRNLLEKFLHKQNHEVRLVPSGEEALVLLKADVYDPEVILLDIQLSGMDGFLTLKQIRKLNKNNSVIMMTGADDLDFRQQALELGAIECLKKPLDLEHLELTIRIRGLGQNVTAR